jgi:hypothetical protein
MATETLEHYLAGDFHRQRKDITDIDELLEHVGDTLCSNYHETLAWPYLLDENGPQRPTEEDGLREAIASGTPRRLRCSIMCFLIFAFST